MKSNSRKYLGILGAVLISVACAISPAQAQSLILTPQGTVTGNKVSLSNVSAQSAAIAGTYVDLVCDVNCFILIAANPTAVADTSYQLIAYTTYRFYITSGNKVAGILSTGTGNLWWHVVQ